MRIADCGFPHAKRATTSHWSRDPTLVYRSLCYDPLTASVLSLAEIKRMVGDMLRKNRKHLPQFKSIRI